MTELNGVLLPQGYNGVGLHDSPGTGAGDWGPEEARAHARDLLAHGIRAYKLLTTGLKLARAVAYHQYGILTAVRRYNGPYVWGTDPRGWVSPPEWFAPWIWEGGVQLFEEGNEWNIDCEHVGNHTPQDPQLIANLVVDMWEVFLERLARYPTAVPLFPSNTPGGNLDHRVCYGAICAELARRGLGSTVRHVAIHPRPFNNPPHATWTEQNSVTFDEWRWIRRCFAEYGMKPFFWATEHGYSLGDHQNANYPPIDRARHTDYNWELLMRMNPWHPAYIQRRLAGVFHWFQGCYGHCGDWGKDALVDSPDPLMGQPSELWQKLGNEAQYLDWGRYPWPYPQEVVMPPIIDLTSVLPRHETERYATRYIYDIGTIVIHHTGHRGRKRRVKPETIANIHVGWGWPGAGYHYEIMPSGTIYMLNQLDTVAYHAGKQHNHGSVGIVLSGNFAEQTIGGETFVLDPTPDQLRACIDLCLWLGSRLADPPDVVFHKDLPGAKTACPGRSEVWGLAITNRLPWLNR